MSSFAQTVLTDKKIGYNGIGQVAAEEVTNSNGDVVTTNYVYPLDILQSPCTTTPEAAGLSYLLSHNIYDVPIETYESVLTQNMTQPIVTKGRRYIYWDNKPYPHYLYELETASGITGFYHCMLDNNCAIISNPNYRLRNVYTLYDGYGNLLEEINYSDLPTAAIPNSPIPYGNSVTTSHIYSYKGAYKTADVVNAANNEIAYTSFENAAPADGFWTIDPGYIITTDAISGNQCSVLPCVIQSQQVPVQKYIVSYWHKNGSVTIPGTTSTKTGETVNGWTYVEHTVENTSLITINGSGYIDELRLYPYSAHMETYTYKPSVGISTKCDLNGRPTYYEYDVIGRLTITRDENKNILKKATYAIQKPD
jgi:hypothetical protein